MTKSGLEMDIMWLFGNFLLNVEPECHVQGKVFSARLFSLFSYRATILLCIAQSRASCYSAVVSLEKAEEFLRTAQLCEEQGWHNSGASRAYYAMFHAVRAALAHAGITRA